MLKLNLLAQKMVANPFTLISQHRHFMSCILVECHESWQNLHLVKPCCHANAESHHYKNETDHVRHFELSSVGLS